MCTLISGINNIANYTKYLRVYIRLGTLIEKWRERVRNRVMQREREREIREREKDREREGEIESSLKNTAEA